MPTEPPSNAGAETSARRAWARHLPDGVDVAAFVAGLTEGCLPQAFAATAAEVPDSVALSVDARSATHADLDSACGRLAGWLAQRLPPGSRVLVWGGASLEMVTAHLGVLRAGCVGVLAGSALRGPEVRQIADDAGVGLAFVDADVLPAATTALSGGPARVPVVGLQRSHGVAALADAVDGGPWVPAPALSPDAPAMIAYTSGTTGVPKGAVLTHANLLASIRSAMAAWRWRRDDVLVHALPLAHQHGLGGVHAALLSGSRTVVLSRFDAAGLVEAVAREGASVLFGVPAGYERVAALGPEGVAALRRLRLVVSGSAPLEPDLALRLADLVGRLPVERYGTTESGLDVSNPVDGPQVPGSIGLPLPGVVARLVDGVGRDVPAGEVGQVLLRGAQVFSGYWGRDADTAEAFDGAWFRTGDLARADPDDGYLTIVGRTKEVIISGGLNVYPREVEAVLESHPSVAEAAVAGVPSREWGEQVTAWVVAAAGHEVDVARIVAHARARLAAYKCPKEVHVVPGLPRNPMGKLERRRLAGAEVLAWTRALDRAVGRLRAADLGEQP